MRNASDSRDDGAMRLDLDRFAREEYAGVVAAVRMITGDRSGAADSVQDAILRYLATPPAVPVRNLAAWITVVAANRSRDRLRRERAERRAVDRLDVPSSTVPGSTAPGSTMKNHLGIDIVAALAALPLRQREICVLFYLLDRPVTEIASATGVSEGTVKTQLHRARHTLALRLAHRRPILAHPRPAIA